jgi:hypothetical protein
MWQGAEVFDRMWWERSAERRGRSAGREKASRPVHVVGEATRSLEENSWAVGAGSISFVGHDRGAWRCCYCRCSWLVEAGIIIEDAEGFRKAPGTVTR